MSDSDTSQYFETGITKNTTPSNFEKAEAIASHGNENKEKPEEARRKSVQHEDNGYGKEYLEQDEVLSNMANNEDTYEVQQAPPLSSNSAKKTAESNKKKGASGEASTPFILRKRRSSSSKKIREGGSSSSRVVNDITSNNSGKTEVTASHGSKKKEKSKSRCKSNKKEGKTKEKPKQGNAPPTYQPQQFMGLYICKEYNGAKTLGTVKAYSPKKKKFKVRFQDERIEYMEQDEVLRNMAKQEDILQCRLQIPPPSSNNNPKKNIVDQTKNKDELGEGSTPITKKRRTSSGPKI